MKVTYAHLDAFASGVFAGNPAGVCTLQRWLEDPQLLALARELNLPATAFLVPNGDLYELRWFAPSGELELCGHATLAAGSMLLSEGDRTRVEFSSLAGKLYVDRDGRRFALDFPALPPREQHMPAILGSVFEMLPREVWEADGGRGMAVLDDAQRVREFEPNHDAIAALPFSALIVTGPGIEGDCDFVSRYFAPRYGIAEDYVTGSAHCVLTPFWARRLDKKKLFARQLSARAGELWLEDRGDRVRIAGECIQLARGTLRIAETV